MRILLFVLLTMCLSAKADLIRSKRVNIKSLFPRGTNGYVLSTINNGTSIGWVNGSTLGGINATTLDGLDSTQFLRSDANDSFTAATLTIDGNGAFNQSVYFDALPTTTATTTTAIDWRLGNKQILDLAASITTFNWTLPAGPAGLQLQVRQNGGSLTIAGYPAAVRWPGGSAPTITAADNSVDWINCVYDGTNIDCQAVQDFQ